jgi:hypothetical protein
VSLRARILHQMSGSAAHFNNPCHIWSLMALNEIYINAINNAPREFSSYTPETK